MKSEPRKLLKVIPGIEFVEIEGADQCCGSAGIYNITQNELSMQILDLKMEKIRKANVDVLVTGNPGCMFQFRYAWGCANRAEAGSPPSGGPPCTQPGLT